jgi:hypothetical protein
MTPKTIRNIAYYSPLKDQWYHTTQKYKFL